MNSTESYNENLGIVLKRVEELEAENANLLKRVDYFKELCERETPEVTQSRREYVLNVKCDNLTTENEGLKRELAEARKTIADVHSSAKDLERYDFECIAGPLSGCDSFVQILELTEPTGERQ